MDSLALRKMLFQTLEGLKNKTIEIDQAKAINETAQSIINCAKVEVDYMRASGLPLTSGFVEVHRPEVGVTNSGNTRIEAVAGGRVISHRMAG